MGLLTDTKKATFININLKWDYPVFVDSTTKEQASKFLWNLVSITVKEPSETNKYLNVNLEFIDNKEDRYIMSWGFSNIMTSIINSLAQGVDEKIDFKNLTFSLYMKDDFARIGIFHNGNMLKWKYDIKDLIAKTKKVRVNGKDVTDREELNNFLKDEIVKINEYLSSVVNNEWSLESLEEDKDINDLMTELDKKEQEVVEEKKETKKTEKDVEEIEDLPF